MAAARKSREARTRGADLLNPLNKPCIPKARRTMTDLLGEHRLEMIHEAKELGRAAATEFEMAEHFGVTVVTLRSWKARDPMFESACNFYQDIGDGRVEARLFDRAVGYSYRSEEIKVIGDTVVRVPVIKHVEPNVTAQIFWLKNRQRDRWRDVQDHKHEGSVDVNVKDDPRSVAMAILSIMREAVEHSASEAMTIDVERNTTQEQAE